MNLTTRMLANALFGTICVLRALLFILIVGVGAFANAQSAESTPLASTANLHKMQFVGHIENPRTKQLVQDIYAKYFANPFAANPDRNMAEQVEFYIAPDVVENFKFIPPVELEFSQEHLEAFEGVFFPNEGCHVRRFHFPNSNEFSVVLIESANAPRLDSVENCVLAATLAALGEDLDGQPVMMNSELRDLIEVIVNGG